MFQNVLAQTKPTGPGLLAAQYISGGDKIFTFNSFSFWNKAIKDQILYVLISGLSIFLPYMAFRSSFISNYAALHITPFVQVWSIHYFQRLDETPAFPLLVTHHYCFAMVWCDYKMSLKNYAATFSSVCETTWCQRCLGAWKLLELMIMLQ